MGKRWTNDEDLLLSAMSREPIEAIRDALLSQFGVERSIVAIRRRASVICVSLMKYGKCEKCGKPYNPHNGFFRELCPKCNLEALMWCKQKRNDLMREIEASERSKELAEKEYHKTRERLRKQLKRIINER